MDVESIFNDILVTPENFEVSKDYLLKIHNNNCYNNVIVDYYKRLQEETRSKDYSRISNHKLDSILNCNKFFIIDKYNYNLVKDFKKTNLCHDKFCNNCKKLKQATRMSKYIPELSKYNDKLYHLTLTLPNVDGDNLKITLKKMSKSFSRLNDYVKLKQKRFFLYDYFKKLGFIGSIRSLEITFKGDSYHPHYHCAFAFKNLVLDKKIENIYSKDYYNNRSDRLFSEFEIIIQKLWYLLINDIRVTKDNFDNLDLGYSCICDKFSDDDYIELFKYMTKETDEKSNILTYNNFKVLYYSTYDIKQIQGYGAFYNINDSDLDDEVDKMYASIICFLKEDEVPVETLERPFDLLSDDKYTLISRNKVYQYLKDLNKKD